MRHVSRTHRVALDWLFDRINLDSKIQIKYIDTKNQLADILTKGISHVMSGIICWICTAAMAKRAQQGSGEERVTAKSRPTYHPKFSLGKRSYGNQNPCNTIAEKEEGSVRPDIGSDRKTAFDYYHDQFRESSSSASYSKWDDYHAWSSQEWKTDTEMCERSGRPDVTSWGATRESQPGFSHEETHHDGTAQSVVNEAIPRQRSGRPDVDPQEGAWPQQFVIGNDEAELKLSVESRSFVNRVNDQVRKRQKFLSLIGDERVINLQRTKVYVFSDSVLCFVKILENPSSNDAWEQRFGMLRSSPKYRNFDRIDGEPMEFEWNIFPGFNTLQLGEEVKRLLLRLHETPENFTGRIIFMSMFNDISCGTKDNERECLANSKVVSILEKKFGIGQWSFIGPGSEKKWCSIR